MTDYPEIDPVDVREFVASLPDRRPHRPRRHPVTTPAARDTVPALLAAVEAVVGMHYREQEDPVPSASDCCAFCWSSYPCPTTVAIADALGVDVDG